MYRYICEYCKSHLPLYCTSCPNCGAPVPYIHPATNLHNNPRFVPDTSTYRGLTITYLDPEHFLWETRRAQER